MRERVYAAATAATAIAAAAGRAPSRMKSLFSNSRM